MHPRLRGKTIRTVSYDNVQSHLDATICAPSYEERGIVHRVLCHSEFSGFGDSNKASRGVRPQKCPTLLCAACLHASAFANRCWCFSALWDKNRKMFFFITLTLGPSYRGCYQSPLLWTITGCKEGANSEPLMSRRSITPEYLLKYYCTRLKETFWNKGIKNSPRTLKAIVK